MQDCRSGLVLQANLGSAIKMTSAVGRRIHSIGEATF